MTRDLAATDPWEIRERALGGPAAFVSMDGPALDAIARGLRSMGYEDALGTEDAIPTRSWPDWACAAYDAMEPAMTFLLFDDTDVCLVEVVRVVAGWPEADRNALVAAEALGGADAVRQMLDARLAQGELAGRIDPQEGVVK